MSHHCGHQLLKVPTYKAPKVRGHATTSMTYVGTTYYLIKSWSCSMANKSNRASAASLRLAERRNRQEQEQEQKQDKKVSPTAADIPDSRNRLLSTTAKRSPHDYAQLRAMSVTSVP